MPWEWVPAKLWCPQYSTLYVGVPFSNSQKGVMQANGTPFASKPGLP